MRINFRISGPEMDGLCRFVWGNARKLPLALETRFGTAYPWTGPVKRRATSQ